MYGLAPSNNLIDGIALHPEASSGRPEDEALDVLEPVLEQLCLVGHRINRVHPIDIVNVLDQQVLAGFVN